MYPYYGVPIDSQGELESGDQPKRKKRLKTLEELEGILNTSELGVFLEALYQIKGLMDVMRASRDHDKYKETGKLPEYVKEYIVSTS